MILSPTCFFEQRINLIVHASLLCLFVAVLHESWPFVRFVTCLVVFSEVWLFLSLPQGHRPLRPFHIQGDILKILFYFLGIQDIFTPYLPFENSKCILFPLSKSMTDI